MERLSLKNRVAIVTGASSGIGQAVAVLFAKRGAKLVLSGRKKDKLDKAKQLVLDAGTKPEEVLVVVGDINLPEVQEQLVRETIDEFGQINILSNNAGVSSYQFVRDVTMESVDEMLKIHYKTPLFLSKACLPHLIKTKGSIINCTSVCTDEVCPGLFAYSAAKAALNTFTRYAAAELGKTGVRVNSVRPGMIITNLSEHLGEAEMANRSAREEMIRKIGIKQTVLGRNGLPEEVAEVVAFYASDASSFTTGDYIKVDGGRTVNYHNGVNIPMPSYDDLIE